MQIVKASVFKEKCLHLMDVVNRTGEEIVIQWRRNLLENGLHEIALSGDIAVNFAILDDSCVDTRSPSA